jgi:branched-chain amino acid aminotransferase
MPLAKSEKIWMDGKFVDWDDAKIHVCSHVVHYGTAVFEGMRCYKTPMGRAAFRLGPHVKRLFNSAKIYRMEIPFSEDAVSEAIGETVRVNRMDECYIRPIAFRGYSELGVNPFPNPVNLCIIVWKWGKYLGADAIDDGVDVCVSSWTRIAPNTLPALAKCGANYMNSQLIKMEALLGGYAEGIALDAAGYVSEGSGENLFIVCEGKLITPPLGASVLPGITRDCVIRLAADLDIPVVEKIIPREMLYLADEVFFTGSAAEITPIRSIDKIKIGAGKCGPVTKQLQKRFFGILGGEVEDKYKWLTIV